jgi:diaminohydroxyphosphoribosylaminopyrimidine deaminase/5-amino-6-(5-phosphoribosylamino)uracil reductase
MSDAQYLRLALRLARRGYGTTSPNPMVGAALVKGGKIIGRGWHRQAGGPHAEIEALHDAQRHGHAPRGATLYVTLEPCCTHGRTPPCTTAIIAAGIKRVISGATDPNPKHAGKGFEILTRAGIHVTALHEHPPLLAAECTRLNEAFNHWIIRRMPFVTVKSAMTLDGKIATVGGESKWITGEKARAFGMKLRRGSDAILVGINTILTDDPSLNVRTRREDEGGRMAKPIRRIVLDSMARTPLTARVVKDEFAAFTTIVVSKQAPKKRAAALAKRVSVLVAPTAKPISRGTRHPSLDLRWLLKKLGSQDVTSLLVEGGGEVNASFLLGGLAQRVAFFYAPKVLGGREARKSVAGAGATSLRDVVRLKGVRWRKVGEDLLLTASVQPGGNSSLALPTRKPKAVASGADLA